jgi:hypothetical protein
LPDVGLGLLRVSRILDEDVEHLRAREVLAQTVRSSSLNTASRGWDEPFESRGVQASSELFFFGFDTGNNGNGKEVLIDFPVELEDVPNFSVGFGFCEECGVAFLPKELACTEERFCELVC